MSKLTVEIDQAITERFPEITIGGLTVCGLRSIAKKVDSDSLLKDAIAYWSSQGLTNANLGNNPNIASWRHAFHQQGLKPSKYRTSPDALARRVLRGDNIQTKLPIVDTYNAISLRHLTPLGAYDLDRLPGQTMLLRFANPERDNFSPLGAESSGMPLLETVAVYAIEDEVMCWGVNHRDSRLACLQPETDFAVFFSEGIVQQHRSGIVSALSELRQLFLGAGASVSEVSTTSRSGPPLVLSWSN